MAKIRALGTKIEFNSKEVKNLTSIGEVSPDTDELDATTLDSTGGYREFIQGFKDGGEVTLTGYYDSADAGQAEIITGYGSGTKYTTVITLPSGAGTITFQSYVKGYSLGSADVDGIVGFGASLRVSGSVAVA